MNTGLGIWAFGAMGTRFVPGGYQPQWANETTAAKIHAAELRAGQGEKDAVSAYELVHAALGA